MELIYQEEKEVKPVYDMYQKIFEILKNLQSIILKKSMHPMKCFWQEKARRS